MALTKEVLLPVYEAEETALLGCAVLFTLDYADLLSEHMEAFRAQKEKTGMLHMSVYASEYRGRFFADNKLEVEDAPPACMAHQILISEFLETETSAWVVKARWSPRTASYDRKLRGCAVAGLPPGRRAAGSQLRALIQAHQTRAGRARFGAHVNVAGRR